MSASVTISVNGRIKIEEPPIDVIAARQAANSLVKYPKWVRPGVIRAIKNLNCFEHVRKMVVDGLPASEIARKIQGFGEMKHVSLHTLCTYVDEYRATVPKGEVLKNLRPEMYDRVVKPLEKTVDTIADLTKLKNWMFDRLEMAVNREKTFGMLLPNTEKSFTVAMELVEKIHDIQEKHLARKDDVPQLPGRSNVDFDKVYNQQGLNQTLQDPGSRMRIARFINSMFEYTGKLNDEEKQKVLQKLGDQTANPGVDQSGP